MPFTQFYYSVFAVRCSSLDLTLLECEPLNTVPNLYRLPQVKGSSLSVAKYLVSTLGHQDIMSAQVNFQLIRSHVENHNIASKFKVGKRARDIFS